jgi:hypothetical protein
MVHADVRRVMGHAAARETRKLATYLTGLLRQLASGGAQIGTIPAFSPQICAQELAEMTPLPLINLLDVIVARKWVRRKRKPLERSPRSPFPDNLGGDSVDSCKDETETRDSGSESLPECFTEARLDSVFLVTKPPLQLGLGFARKFICISSEQFRL